MADTEAAHRDPVTCSPSTPCHQAARIMSENEIGSVVVVDDNRRPVGILTDRDLALRLVGTERGPGTPVSEVMTAGPATVSTDASYIDAATQMAARGCRRVPVIDPGDQSLVGIITLDDLLLGAAETIEQVVRVLSHERGPDSSVIDILRRRQVA